MKNFLLTLFTCASALAASAQCSINASMQITPGTASLPCSLTNTTTISNLPTHSWVQSYVQITPVGGYMNLPVNSTATKTLPCGNYAATLIVQVYDSNFTPVVMACSDTITQNFTITCPPCYTTIQKLIGSNGMVTFTANTPAGTSGMTYNWNFGDGGTATGNPVTHTYSANGFYYVTLGASSTSASCVDSSFTNVNVNTVSLQNRIAGDVVGDSLLTDTFKVWLIKYDSATSNLYAVDSTITHLSVYQFNNKPAGIYRTKAANINGPSSGTGYVPTYHDSSLYWNQAKLINHASGNTIAPIFMNKGTVTSGPGFISGNVNQGANKGTSSGIEGMVIILRNINGNLITATYTDANGHYSFNNIPAAAYSVYPEDGGYNTTPSSVVLTGFSTTASGINFERTEKDKSIKPVATGIIDMTAGNTFEIYPNPSNGKVFINWAVTSNSKASVTISNVVGSRVFQSNVDIKNGRSELNVLHLQAGHYFITMDNGNVKQTQKLVIER